MNYFYDLPDDIKDMIYFNIHKSLFMNIDKELKYFNEIFDDQTSDPMCGAEGSDWLRTVEYMAYMKIEKLRKKDMPLMNWIDAYCSDEGCHLYADVSTSSLLYDDEGIKQEMFSHLDDYEGEN